MAGEDSALGVLVLGLDGFRLVAATDDDGELLMGVETDASWAACSTCGTRAKSKGRRKSMVRDLPVGGRPVVLVWFKRRWRCPEADCGVKSWTETSPRFALGRFCLGGSARVGRGRGARVRGGLVDGDGRRATVRRTVGGRAAGFAAGCGRPRDGRTPVAVPSGQVGDRSAPAARRFLGESPDVRVGVGVVALDVAHRPVARSPGDGDTSSGWRTRWSPRCGNAPSKKS